MNLFPLNEQNNNTLFDFSISFPVATSRLLGNACHILTSGSAASGTSRFQTTNLLLKSNQTQHHSNQSCWLKILKHNLSTTAIRYVNFRKVDEVLTNGFCRGVLKTLLMGFIIYVIYSVLVFHFCSHF